MFKRTVMSLLLAGCAGSAMAQSYPVRPVTLVVGFPPGGGADAVARIVADKIGKTLGQPMLVDNRPGAGTTLASEHVARAPADGYTLLLGSASIYGSDQLLYKSARYDGARNFTPITRWSSAPMLLAVRKDFPAQDVGELIALVRSQPGRFSYSSSGAGVITHLAALSFAGASGGLRMLHVPFKGGAPSIQAVGAGDVDLSFGTPPSVLPLAQSGRLRVLAVSTAQRSPLFPDLPGMQESGVPGFDYTFWFGLFAPAGLPDDVAQKLFDASASALQDAEVKSRLASQGNLAAPSASVEEFRAWALKEGQESKALTQRSGAGVQ
ncbi:Bug family tripartite tricarboxylate transporter substrate binding protein [Delftia sp. PS-11]|uniref:Bug family tripartite tricarboxylate transporter substrate binding protein n=1 Tax=Delftia sp. PS-11 TaxID=2767222 RepID=UPI0024575EA8|nr:tripartite tricarboxylate transporter substrate binding protein [Delftia sp. PS-11]KAJ8745559.1 tripartite tricarboxylate transporter substrate binding protein [Delftia sp. PS-11]